MAILAVMLVLLVAADDAPEPPMRDRGKITEFRMAKDDPNPNAIAYVTIKTDDGLVTLRVLKSTRLEKIQNGKIEPCVLGDFNVVGGFVDAESGRITQSSLPPIRQPRRMRLLEK